MPVETTEHVTTVVWLIEHAKEVGHEFVLLTLGGFAYVTMHAAHHRLTHWAMRFLPRRLRRGKKHG